MKRNYNFSAGPAMLPEAILEQAQAEFVEWQAGVSVSEISHRDPCFMAVVEQARATLRELLAIPSNYHVLFMQAGATAQFAGIPMNLLGEKKTADYIDTGFWAGRAIEEAKLYCEVNVAASSKANNYTDIPDVSDWQLNPDAAYVHFASNETIGGVEFKQTPEVGDVPLVADMSSNILSKPIDVSRYGLIYAGAQKNIGPAGITIVIIRDDLVGHAWPTTPSVLDYQRFVKDGFYNTPPTFIIYMANLAFQWLKQQGGVAAIAKRNEYKAQLLYDAIDQSDFYQNPVALPARSCMNVPFTLAKPELDQQFLQEAKQQGLVSLKGHRSVGGMRASIYNAMPESGVKALISFMQDFAQRYG